jgi:hypothetical protein
VACNKVLSPRKDSKKVSDNTEVLDSIEAGKEYLGNSFALGSMAEWGMP